MSPLDVSISTSAPSVGGTLSVTSPDPVSMLTWCNLSAQLGRHRAASGLERHLWRDEAGHLDIARASLDGQLLPLQVGRGDSAGAGFDGQRPAPDLGDLDGARPGIYRKAAIGLRHSDRAGSDVDVEVPVGPRRGNRCACRIDQEITVDVGHGHLPDGEIDRHPFVPPNAPDAQIGLGIETASPAGDGHPAAGMPPSCPCSPPNVPSSRTRSWVDEPSDSWPYWIRSAG